MNVKSASSPRGVSASLSSLITRLLRESKPRHLVLFRDNKYINTDDLFPLYTDSLSVSVDSCHDSTLSSIESPLPRTAVLTLCNEDSLVSVLKKVRDQGLESHHIQWLSVILRHSEPRLEENLSAVLRRGTKVSLKPKFTLVQEKEDGTFSLSKTRDKFTNQIQFEFLVEWEKAVGQTSTWRLSENVTLFPPASLYPDLEGRKLIVAANDDWPFFGQKMLPNGTIVGTYGIDLTVVRTLAERLNFRFEVKRPPKRQWGSVFPNGSANGLLGMVSRWEADMAIDQITITPIRTTVLDFTIPHMTDVTKIISLAPALKSKTLAIIEPFSPNVWLCYVTALILVSAVTFLLNNASQRMKTRDSIRGRRRHSANTLNKFRNNAFNIFRAQMAQGFFMRNLALPTQTMMAFWLLYCLNIGIYYSGFLTAILTVPAYEKAIDNLEDALVATKNGHILGTIGNTVLEKLFSEAEPDTIFHQIYKSFTFKDSLNFSTPLQVIDRVEQGGFSYIGPDLGSKVICTKRGIRRFHFSRKSFYPQLYGMALPKGSTYLNIFNPIIRRMTEAGLIKRWIDIELNRARRTTVEVMNKQKNLQIFSLQHLQAAFYMYLIGILVAFAVLFTELCIKKRKMKRSNRNSSHY